MSRPAFTRLFESRQVPAKGDTDYAKKQAEEPTEPPPTSKRGRVSSPLGPLHEMSREQIVHQLRGTP